VVPDEIAFGAAIDAHRRAGNSVKALECLQDMYRNKLEPTAAHYNLVIRTLKAEGYVEKMFKMVMAVSYKEGARINGNTFELCIEAVIEQGQWKVCVHTYDDYDDDNDYDDFDDDGDFDDYDDGDDDDDSDVHRGGYRTVPMEGMYIYICVYIFICKFTYEYI
jgi:pentatricopeptide repeat protein